MIIPPISPNVERFHLYPLLCFLLHHITSSRGFSLPLPLFSSATIFSAIFPPFFIHFFFHFLSIFSSVFSSIFSYGFGEFLPLSSPFLFHYRCLKPLLFISLCLSSASRYICLLLRPPVTKKRTQTNARKHTQTQKGVYIFVKQTIKHADPGKLSHTHTDTQTQTLTCRITREIRHASSRHASKHASTRAREHAQSHARRARARMRTRTGGHLAGAPLPPRSVRFPEHELCFLRCFLSG